MCVVYASESVYVCVWGGGCLSALTCRNSADCQVSSSTTFCVNTESLRELKAHCFSQADKLTLE